MDVTLPARHVSISLPIEEASGVAEARRFAMKLAEALQFSESDIGRVALVVTEAATNIVQHAGRGEILLRPFALEAPASLEVLALDKGPGMANVAEALRDGFSTGGSPGHGLGSIARLSTCFEISSAPGKGTALLARIGRVKPKRPAEPGLEWGVVCVPKREEEVCGDAWAVTAGHVRNTILVVDGLGHGLPAFDAASEALRAFWERAGERPESILNALHENLRATRGVVAGVAEIDWDTRELRWAGAGNIAGTLVPVEGKASSLVSHSGTVGQNVTRFQEFTHRWPDEGLLILHSDGLSSRWALEPYPGLTRKDPSLVAGVLYRDFASRRDDVVIFVGRERERNTRERGREPA
jgi:anti-sigma regulatory factor (Ser/Thr protein kinase)